MIRRSSEKRWGFLFTCMTLRVIHLEVVPSMDTSSCVMGIERFISRRGTPPVIWSDNGTSFVASTKKLISCMESCHRHAPVLPAQKGLNSINSVLLIMEVCGKCSPEHQKSFFYDSLGTRKLTDDVSQLHFI